MPVIPADNTFAIWAVLLGGAAFAAWSEHTRWGHRMSGVMVAILFAMVLSNTRIIPFTSPTYDSVFQYVVPVAIPMLLFGANLRRIIRETGAMLIGFVIAAIGVLIGTWIGMRIVPLGEDASALAGIFASTYIGGSLNFVAVAQATGFADSGRMAASIAADALVGAVYLIVLMGVPGILWLRRRMPSPAIERAEAEFRGEQGTAAGERVPFDLFGVSLSLGLAFAIAALGYWLADLTGLDGFGILFISALALVPGNLFPGLVKHLTGHMEAGMLMIYVFLFVIGATADIWTMVESALPLALFATIIVGVHMVFTFAVGAVFRLDLAELVIASNACVGGSSSAGPIAAARGWKDLVTPGILCGALGNAVGTFIGVGVARVF